MKMDEEMMKHPKVQQSTMDLVSKILSKEKQNACEAQIHKNMSKDIFPTDYIDEVLAGEKNAMPCPDFAKNKTLNGEIGRNCEDIERRRIT